VNFIALFIKLTNIYIILALSDLNEIYISYLFIIGIIFKFLTARDSKYICSISDIISPKLKIIQLYLKFSFSIAALSKTSFI
jgi:hypothetical protein